MKKYKGNTVTAVRYGYLVVANDDYCVYQIIRKSDGEELYENTDEYECLKRLITLSGVDDYDNELIAEF